MAYQAAFENERRFLSLDLLCGRVNRSHPLFGFLIRAGASAHELGELTQQPCPPDLIGVNYYVTSDRYLDERCDLFPPRVHGSNGRDTYADVEAVRALPDGIEGHARVLLDSWERYRIPVALTEVHLGCAPDEQIRWIHEAWEGACAAQQAGADVHGVTLWSLLGAYDWDSLVTRDRGAYEPGLYDVRTGEPRATEVVEFARSLARNGRAHHPALAVPGWWRRPERILYPTPRWLGPTTQPAYSAPTASGTAVATTRMA
jgi:dTDP-4-dehydrorhamnose reductase